MEFIHHYVIWRLTISERIDGFAHISHNFPGETLLPTYTIAGGVAQWYANMRIP